MKNRIFITGASSGIGRATAELLVRQGYEVWGTSRDPARLPRMEGLHPVALDLSVTAKARATFAQALAEAGHFDVVINNAGSGHFSPSETASAEMVEKQFQVLVFAQIELSRVALAAMRAYGSGLLINVSSLASRLPVPFMGIYNAAKAAIASYTMTLQLELGDSPIRVIDLQPGDIRTSFNDTISPADDGPRYAAKLRKSWAVVDRNMKGAPSPELVARRISGIIENRKPPLRVTVGDRFQSFVAPLIFRFLPQRIRVWGLRRYYGI